MRLEETFDLIDYRPALRWLIWLIFAIALLTCIVFSFNTQTHFFQTPAG